MDLEDDKEIVDLAIHEVPQSKPQTFQIPQGNQNAIKLSNIKLLTSDDAAVEFLTLCTMKRSQHERTDVDRRKTNPYFPSFHENHENTDFSYEIPDLRILDCLKYLEPYVAPITHDENDEESIFHAENEFFRPSGCFDDFYENQDSRSNDNDLGDSRFEALLDDSSGDSEKTHCEALEQDEQDYPIDEKVDWEENVSGVQFEDLVDAWSDETRMTTGKKEWKDQNNGVPKTDVQEKFDNFKNIFNTTKPNEAKNSTHESFGMEEESAKTEFGNFERLLNDDSETSSEKNKSNLTNHETSNDLAEKTGAFGDLLNDEWEISSEKSTSDPTAQGPEKTSFFENLLDDDSTTKSDIDDFRQGDLVAAENEETKINSQARVDRLENISIPLSDDSLTQFDGEFNINNQNIQFSSPTSRKNIDNNVENEKEAASIEIPGKSIESRELTERNGDDSIDLLDDSEPRNSLSPHTEKIYFGVISEISKNSTPKQAVSSSVLPADERAGASNKFVNKDAQGPGTSHCLDTEPRNLPFGGHENSRETQCQREVTAEKETESDDDIFAADDILVDSDFEEKINEIEKSAEPNVSTINEGDSDVKNKSVNDFESDSRENDELEKARNIEVNVSNEKKLWPEFENPERPINHSREKRVDSEVSSPVTEAKKLENSPKFQESKNPRDRDSVPQTSLGSKSSSIRLTDTDLNLDDCDWEPIDFEVPAENSQATSSTKNSVNCAEATDRDWTNRPKTEAKKVTDSGCSLKATGWLSTEKPKSRLSLSKKLTRNICNSFWSAERSKNLEKRDSDSENDFTVLRLETTLSKVPFDDDCFSKPKPVSTTRKLDEFAAMSKSIGSIRSPLSLKRQGVNKPEGTKLSSFAAPSKYRERETVEKNNSERKLGVGKPRSASCNLDTRKRKKVQMHSNSAKRLRSRNDFIDDEADVSSDCEASSGSSGCDDDLDGFVSYTQNVDDHVDMQAHYLQTIKSPRKIVGGFYLKKTRNPSPDLQIYSQPLPDEPNHYVNVSSSFLTVN